jgi:predicted DNA-binding protein YlxM (UPF0122 family)
MTEIKKPCFYDSLSPEVIKENITDCYNTLLKVKDYKNILKPMSDDICKMGLNFPSNKLKLVSDNLDTVKQFINGDISMDQLFELSNKSLQNCLDLFKTPCKSVDEINTTFQRYNKSKNKIDDIMNLIEKYQLNDDELFELSTKIIHLKTK